MDHIVVRRHGSSGPAVLVLHGGPGAPGSVADLARELGQRGFVALEPLQRWSGGEPLTVERHVADLADVAPERAIVVGWSWGAMLGLSFAACHPDRVRALALVGCGTYDEASRETYSRSMARRLGPDGLVQMASLGQRLRAATDAAERDALIAERGALAGRAMAVDPLEPPEGERNLPADSRGHAETWEDVLRLQHEGVEPARFAAIRCPVLMLHGDEDPEPGPMTRDVLGALLPQLEYVGLAACGHTPWLERRARDEFFEVLCSWLAARAGEAIAPVGPAGVRR